MNKPLVKTSVQYVTIEQDFTTQRIDNFLITRLKGVPKTHIYRLLRKGEVRVNKKRIGPSYRLQEGDEVRIPPVKLMEEAPRNQPSRSMVAVLSERILYEDKYLLIINKPPGIPVHGGTHVKIGVIEALKSMFPKLPHLELAHRLDADTSGCLILAKKRGILKELHELLRNGQMRKVYWTLTEGHWLPSQLRVDKPLLKNQVSSGERIVKVNSEGKAALTVFKSLKEFKQASLMEATLHTGRTHQIRVHAQSQKHPIAGDEKYGNKDFNKVMREFGVKRLFLHARLIEFKLPSLEQSIRVEAPLDQDLANVLTLLENDN